MNNGLDGNREIRYGSNWGPVKVQYIFDIQDPHRIGLCALNYYCYTHTSVALDMSKHKVSCTSAMYEPNEIQGHNFVLDRHWLAIAPHRNNETPHHRRF
jgi:hypothetical protein